VSCYLEGGEKGKARGRLEFRLAQAILTPSACPLFHVQMITILAVIGFAIALVIFATPIAFIGTTLFLLLSIGGPSRLKRNWLLFLAWGALSFVIFYITLGPVVQKTDFGRCRITRQDLTSMAAELKYYQDKNGYFSAHCDSQLLFKALATERDWMLKTNRRELWKVDWYGEPVDDWGTPIRIIFDDPRNPVAYSAGADKKWDTADDVYSDKSP
jgi:hypothetical protein